MNVRRFLQAGAVWGWPFLDNPLAEARSRYTVTGAPGIVESPWGLALDLDGANDYITLRDSEEFLLRFDSAPFSIAIWFRVASATNSFLFSKEDGVNDGWAFRLDTFDDRIYFNLDGNGANTGVAVDDGLWHSLVGVVDFSANSTLLYLDGVQVGSTIAPAMATTVLPTIGARAYNQANKFRGEMAGIVIWDRTLTPAEALALAQPGRSF